MKIKSKKWIEREKLKEWRARVLFRDEYICQVCNKRTKLLFVHHIIPKQEIELKYDVMNGITLCYNHHKVGIHSPHQNCLWFFIWFRENKSNQFNYLLEKLK